jgi:hypothetical protein
MAVELACGWQNELVGADNGRRYAAYFVPSRENLSAQLDFAFRFERLVAGEGLQAPSIAAMPSLISRLEYFPPKCGRSPST